SEHDHAFLPSLRDRGVLSLPVRDRDQDPLDAGGRHVLDRRDLTRVVGAALSGRVDETCAEPLRRLRRSRVHLDEERIGGVLRNQTDLDLCALRPCRSRRGGDDSRRGDNDCEERYRETQRPPCRTLELPAHLIPPLPVVVVPITRLRRNSQAERSWFTKASAVLCGTATKDSECVRTQPT